MWRPRPCGSGRALVPGRWTWTAKPAVHQGGPHRRVAGARTSGGATLPEGFDATGAAEEPVRRGRVTATTPSSWSTRRGGARRRRGRRGGGGRAAARRQRRPAPRITSTEFLRSWVLGCSTTPSSSSQRSCEIAGVVARCHRHSARDPTVPCRAIGGVAGRRAQRRSPRARRVETRAHACAGSRHRVVAGACGSRTIAEVAQRFDIPPTNWSVSSSSRPVAVCRPTRRTP